MGKSHLSTLASPRGWFVGRKKYGKWIVRPSPGPHPLKSCIPLAVLLKDMLRHAKNAKEVRKILNDGSVFIDNAPRKKHNFPVGLMDIVHIKPTGESFRIVIGEKDRLILVPVKDADKKLLKVIGKTLLKKGMLQINFHDGRNLLADGLECAVGDSVVFDLKSGKVIKRIIMQKGCLVLIDGGRYVGAVGRVKDIVSGDAFKEPLVVFDVGGKEYTTLKDYAFAVGEGDSEVALGSGI